MPGIANSTGFLAGVGRFLLTKVGSLLGTQGFAALSGFKIIPVGAVSSDLEDR